MTNIQWRSVFGVAAAVDAFILIQTDVALPPIVKLILGALAVGLAVIDPNRSHGDAE